MRSTTITHLAQFTHGMQRTCQLLHALPIHADAESLPLHRAPLSSPSQLLISYFGLLLPLLPLFLPTASAGCRRLLRLLPPGLLLLQAQQLVTCSAQIAPAHSSQSSASGCLEVCKEQACVRGMQRCHHATHVRLTMAAYGTQMHAVLQAAGVLRDMMGPTVCTRAWGRLLSSFIF